MVPVLTLSLKSRQNGKVSPDVHIPVREVDGLQLPHGSIPPHLDIVKLLLIDPAAEPRRGQ